MQTPIAIIGLGCRFPQADGPEDFWRLLAEGVDALGEVPAERWPAEAFFDPEPGRPGRTYCPRGGFISQGDGYDADLFHLSPREAERVDPQQGLALEVSWQALEHAGIAPDSLNDTETGTFWGVSTRDYDRRLANQWDDLDARASTGACGAIIANRISYSLGLCGPSVAVDAACASSLVAVHLACQSLSTGECRLALAGGVHLVLSPANSIAFSQGKLLARDGRCKSFSSQADGYVFGEGAGVLVLKRLEDALRDGDFIWAVIRGSATNHNGPSNGLTAPLGRAQQQVVRRALEMAGVPPASVSYVEAHASGTLLGDTIEVNALKSALGAEREPGRRCVIGSVKSNIGHLEAAAGIAGMLKVILSLAHGEIPPSLHCEPLNPHLRLEGTPFSIATHRQPWPDGGFPRRAGVSSLSFGGTNAHVVLEEPPERAPVSSTAQAEGQWLLPLSAHSPEALEGLVERHVSFLRLLEQRGGEQARSDFAQACFTLATGRAHLRHRLAVLASTAADAADALSAYLQGGTDARLFVPRQDSLHAKGTRLIFSTPSPSTLQECPSEPWRSHWLHLRPLVSEVVARHCPPESREQSAEAERLLAAALLLARCGFPFKTVEGEDALGSWLAQLLAEQLPSLLSSLGAGPRSPPEYVPESPAPQAAAAPKRETYLLLLGGHRTEAPGARVLSVLGQPHEVGADIATALATFYVHGGGLDWRALYAHLPYRPVPLPTYAFQRRRHHVIPGGELGVPLRSAS